MVIGLTRSRAAASGTVSSSIISPSWTFMFINDHTISQFHISSALSADTCRLAPRSRELPEQVVVGPARDAVDGLPELLVQLVGPAVAVLGPAVEQRHP